MSEPSTRALADFEDDDADDEEFRTPAQWLFDNALLPGTVLLLTTLVFLTSVAAIWATLYLCGSIVAMVS